MYESFLAGIVLGLSLAAPPGPMNAIIAEESVLRGWGAGIFAGAGAMIADACFFVVALAGALTVVRTIPSLRGVMMLVGGGLMLWFAVDAVRDTRAAFTAHSTGPRRGFRKAFVLALTNPFQILWWLTVGITLLEPGRYDLVSAVPWTGASIVIVTGGGVIIVGLFSGILLWITAFPALLVAVGERFDGFAPAIALTSAAVLAAFGVGFLLGALRLLGFKGFPG